MRPICQFFLFCCPLLVFSNCHAQTKNNGASFSRQDTLRGSITPERAWWDVLHYGISVEPDFLQKTIEGTNDIRFRVTEPGDKMQLDLQEPMVIESVNWNDKSLETTRDGNIFRVSFPMVLPKGSEHRISVKFSGKPREARNPPWDGGWIWQTDKEGDPWMSVACQGLGASVWYPCKDHQSDEPDSASLTMIVPDTLVGIGNGRLRSRKNIATGKAAYTWAVTNPINSYNIIPYIGKYVNWTETINGEKGRLDCSYWVLRESVDSAKKQFGQVAGMIKCFEYWFGPYPFYEDGYKLVQSPHLGMEHQSAVAYGNHFGNGYLGKDLSSTGWGLKWDFIIIHESGHEWFGNSISSKDIADMWVHEGFTNYSETIYTACEYGTKAGQDYVIGTRKQIENKTPIIGRYGVNNEGSGDMYSKGGNLIHNIRMVINNDSTFRKILRGLNKTYYHQTVTSREVEAYISREAGMDLSKIFDQYLRTTGIPVLEYKINGQKITYRWTNCVEGFNMPLRIFLQSEKWIKPTTAWQTLNAGMKLNDLEIDRNFYVEKRRVTE